MKKKGKYTLLNELGHGGNGKVYRVSYNNNYLAMKVLNGNGYSNPERFDRFKTEIGFLKDKKFDGVLPLVDYNIDENRPENTWYVMPIAECIKDIAKNWNFECTVKYMYQVAKTLENLHSEQIYHRDIKPENLFLYEGQCVLSDFGLVSFPSKQNITKTNKKIGPGNTIAPEMKYYKKDIDLEKADVYSLAKTFWILLSKQEHAFDGRYDRNDSVMDISCYLGNDVYSGWIHDLLEKSTSNNPSERPSIKDFSNAIYVNFISSNKKFLSNSRSEWDDAIHKVQNRTVPYSILWKDKKEICKVLEMLSTSKEGNHLFYSWGGGNTISKMAIPYDDQFVEIGLDKMVYIFSPLEMYFIPINNNPDYSFFWIDLENIKPIDEKNARLYVEDLVEVNGENNNFISKSQSENLKGKDRYVHRIFKGSLMIAGKSSFWNYYAESYSAESYKNGFEGIRDFLCKLEKEIPNVATDICQD